MGKQKGLYLHGKSENILYYSWKDIPCMRNIPANVYQSPGVVAHKKANGLSTAMGASFRKLLAEIIPYPKSMQMQTAVRLALLKWLKGGPVATVPPAGIPFISGLSFNEAAILGKCLHIQLTLVLTAQNELTVLVPEIKPETAFTAPEHTQYIRLKLSAACCNFKTGAVVANDNQQIHIPYIGENIPAQTISFSLEMPADSLTIVAAAVEYFINKNGSASLCTDKHFRPAAITGGVITTFK